MPNKWCVKHGLLSNINDKKLYKINKKFCRTFYDIKQRCVNKKTASYKYAGARKIKCEWRSLLEFKLDMYDSYLEHIKNNSTHNTTIDRINVNGNYCKKNCRWATQFEQSRNKRNLKMITFGGKTQCQTDWEKELGLHRNSIYTRVNVRGWSIKRALTTKHRWKRRTTNTKNN